MGKGGRKGGISADAQAFGGDIVRMARMGKVEMREVGGELRVVPETPGMVLEDEEEGVKCGGDLGNNFIFYLGGVCDVKIRTRKIFSQNFRPANPWFDHYHHLQSLF